MIADGRVCPLLARELIVHAGKLVKTGSNGVVAWYGDGVHG